MPGVQSPHGIQSDGRVSTETYRGWVQVSRRVCGERGAGPTRIAAEVTAAEAVEVWVPGRRLELPRRSPRRNRPIGRPLIYAAGRAPDCVAPTSECAVPAGEPRGRNDRSARVTPSTMTRQRIRWVTNPCALAWKPTDLDRGLHPADVWVGAVRSATTGLDGRATDEDSTSGRTKGWAGLHSLGTRTREGHQ
jgi:hypothetical protein